MSHQDAARVVTSAWHRTFGVGPGKAERQICQALGCFETGYGSQLGGNNWGAVLARLGEPWVPATDSSPINGVDVKSVRKFRSYNSHADGCAGMLQVVSQYLGAVEAAKQGDVLGFATALHRDPGKKYYEGLASDKTAERRRMRRAGNLLELVITIARACGEDVLATGEYFPTVDSRLQPEANSFVALGGLSVVEFQRLRGLTPDGVIGPKTWTQLILNPHQAVERDHD